MSFVEKYPMTSMTRLVVFWLNTAMSPSELTGTITPVVAGPLPSTFRLEVFGSSPSPDHVVR
jgi:hypothetical protein